MLNKSSVLMLCGLLCGLLCVNSAYAQTVSGPPPATVGQLAQIQDRLAESEARRQAAEEALAQGQAPKPTVSKKGTSRPSTSNTTQPPADLPVVKLVHGVNKDLHAIFLFANGAQVDASLGDTLPGGYSVSEIRAEEVVLSQGKARYPLAFSLIAPTLNMTTPSGTDNDMQIKAIPLDLIPGVPRAAPFRMPGLKPKESANGQ